MASQGHVGEGVHIRALLDSWELHLAAENKSRRTIQSYLEAAGQFAGFLEAESLPTAVGAIRSQDVAA